MMEVHLVADTNLFFECRILEELPWHELGFDPVVILVTKPVLDEIDKHKKANGRTRGRALDIFGRVRKMLTAGVQETEIQALEPKVILRRAPTLKPNPDLKDDLDYTRTDEKLVGIVSMLAAKAVGYEVKLFTDDTGPAATADSTGVPFLMVDESWRRPPAESTEDKQIKDLQKDLATYRAQEPAIRIAPCEPANAAGEIEVTRKIATPLTEAEVAALIKALCQKHPIKTDFVPQEASSWTTPSGEVVNVRWEPPDAESITTYRDTTYPKWLEDCGTALRQLHLGRDEMETQAILRWTMVNEGTRPALAVRVEFAAQGPLQLLKLQDHDQSVDEDTEEPTVKVVGSAVASTKLPSPPKPPSCQKIISRVAPITKAKSVQSVDIATLGALGLLPKGYNISAMKMAGILPNHLDAFSDATKALRMAGLDQRHLSNLRAITDITKGLDLSSRFADLSGSNDLLRSIAFAEMAPTRSIDLKPFKSYIPPPHDPEAFYYDWPGHKLVEKGALTCDLWRHRTDKEVFEFEVMFTKDGEACGSVLCTVHAENLTKPETSRVTVRRKVENVSMLDLATQMVDNC